MATAEIAADILSIRRRPSRRQELVSMLAEQSPIYQGLGTSETERIRGFVLASFEKTGLPPAALPFVLEELETGLNPYTVAAAAKALRGAGQIPDHALSLLAAAATRIKSNDDYVQYDSITPHDQVSATKSALSEIIHTLGAAGVRAHPFWDAIESMAARGDVSPGVLATIVEVRLTVLEKGSDQDCCRPPQDQEPVPTTKPKSSDLDALELEDQSGAKFTYASYLRGRVSVVTFFYTRCMNPQKCSLTISKLVTLQRRLAQYESSVLPINICAFSYDPAYDRANRLLAYGAERNFQFSERSRLLRTTGPFAPLQAAFELGVGFGTATVNRHSVELFVLNAATECVHRFSRVQWQPDDVFDALMETKAS